MGTTRPRTRCSFDGLLCRLCSSSRQQFSYRASRGVVRALAVATVHHVGDDFVVVNSAFSFSLSLFLSCINSLSPDWISENEITFFFSLSSIKKKCTYKIVSRIINISLANIESIKGEREGKRFRVEGKVWKLEYGILFGTEAAERCVLSCRTRGTHWESVNSSLCRVCSVSSGADACPLPFRPPFPLPASSYPRRNRETSKLHARKAESSYLLDSRVATAPPFARNRCEISPIVSEIFPIQWFQRFHKREREGEGICSAWKQEQIIAFRFLFQNDASILRGDGRGIK